ncbi:MAG: hypothetical protein HHJ11_16975 [Phycicoccus sp.]|nr:hypothetical protein [Phycicoccus sp.]
MNQLRDRLAAANPVPDLRCYTREQVTATVSMILSDAAQADEAVTKHNTDEIPAVRPRRRRHRWVVGLFAGLIVVPTAAGAVVGGIHTGIFAPSPPDGTSSENAVGEEFLNSKDPEIRSLVRDLTGEFPLPAGSSYAPLLKSYPSIVNTLEQRTTLAQSVSIYAQCEWYQDWLKGDSGRRAADQPIIDAMPTWKYWHFAIDDTTGHNSGLEILNTIVAETRVGTTTMISQYVSANCLGRGPLVPSPDPSPKS